MLMLKAKSIQILHIHKNPDFILDHVNETKGLVPIGQKLLNKSETPLITYT